MYVSTYHGITLCFRITLQTVYSTFFIDLHVFFNSYIPLDLMYHVLCWQNLHIGYGDVGKMIWFRGLSLSLFENHRALIKDFEWTLSFCYVQNAKNYPGASRRLNLNWDTWYKLMTSCPFVDISWKVQYFRYLYCLLNKLNDLCSFQCLNVKYDYIWEILQVIK